MELKYVIINFLILALILFLFGRKIALGIFSRRLERIEKELKIKLHIPKIKARVPESLLEELFTLLLEFFTLL